MSDSNFPRTGIQAVADEDVNALERAHQHYGTSWKNRGGTGAFMMLARKWDRLENAVKKVKYDIFEVVAKDQRAEGAIDDIRDLRRYLLLVEEELMARGQLPDEVQKEAPKPFEHASGCEPHNGCPTGCPCPCHKPEPSVVRAGYRGPGGSGRFA